MQFEGQRLLIKCLNRANEIGAKYRRNRYNQYKFNAAEKLAASEKRGGRAMT